MSNDTYRRGNLLTIARLFCTLGAGLVTVFTPIITQALTASDNAVVTAVQSAMNYLNNGDAVVSTNETMINLFKSLENVGSALASFSPTSDFSGNAAEALKGVYDAFTAAGIPPTIQ